MIPRKTFWSRLQGTLALTWVQIQFGKTVWNWLQGTLALLEAQIQFESSGILRNFPRSYEYILGSNEIFKGPTSILGFIRNFPRSYEYFSRSNICWGHTKFLRILGAKYSWDGSQTILNDPMNTFQSRIHSGVRK
jgi:hypothetical protein